MPNSLAIRTLFAAWFLAAVAVGYFQLLQRLTFPAIPGLVLSLTALLVLAYRRLAAFRTWVDGLDLRTILLLHLSRFVGIYFLVLFQQGRLPFAFAVPGGIGDIIVATAAAAIAFAPLPTGTRERVVSIWNVVGLLDILLVVASAVRIGLNDGGALTEMTVLPLSLLPTFLVPLIIASHVAIFARLAGSRR